MFEFKFKAVLNYRRQLEEVCQQEFAQKKNTWINELQKLEELYELWKKYITEWRSIQKGTISVWALELYQKHMLTLKDEIENQAERVRQCVQAMEEQREKLLQAVKDKKVIEKLEEYHFTEYSRQQRKKETKFLDDIATQRFNIKGPQQ